MIQNFLRRHSKYLVPMALALVAHFWWYMRPMSEAVRIASNWSPNPEAVRTRNVRLVRYGVICGEVNLVDRSGNYVGYQPFRAKVANHFASKLSVDVTRRPVRGWWGAQRSTDKLIDDLIERAEWDKDCELDQ